MDCHLDLRHETPSLVLEHRVAELLLNRITFIETAIPPEPIAGWFVCQSHSLLALLGLVGYDFLGARA